MKPKLLFYSAIFLTFYVMQGLSATTADKARVIINNIEKNNKQSVLSGRIDSLTIKRGNAEFRLGPGNLTLFDFGSGRVAAMTYNGSGRFIYLPSDQIESYQLHKFTGRDTLDNTFEKAAVFFTVEPDWLPDTSHFQRLLDDGSSWDELSSARDEEFDHIGINITDKLIGDLVSSGAGTYFNALFDLVESGKFAFEENPFNGDLYSLYKLVKTAGSESYDYIGGFSPENDLPSQRGVVPIDITHYDINSRIEGNGDMFVKCMIHFMPLRWGRQFIYFSWYGKNKLRYALDSKGDSLLSVFRIDKGSVFTFGTNETGVGLVLNKVMELGQRDSLEIAFDCKSIENVTGNYSISGRTSWYPKNEIRDVSTYNLIFDSPKNLQVVSCGDLLESKISEGRAITRWVTMTPVDYVSFGFGDFEVKQYAVENYSPVKVFLSKTIPHSDLALFMAYFGELSSANMIGQVGADVTNSLIFYSSIFGACPFDTIRAVESFSIGEGQGSPGLVHLSWDTFQKDDIGGRDERFRAHEVAHQWWGHIIDSESYRDTWIIEGLSEYCGFWFYQMSSKNKKACDGTLGYWLGNIISGEGVSSAGSKAGPPTMGIRLFSSLSDDYGVIVYQKGAYIFHMIRYLLHDYKTGSDDAFATFLKDLASKYKGKTITTPKLQELLEDHTGQDMSWFFNQYIYGTDIPEYRVKTSYQKTPDGKYRASCHITESNVPENFRMMIPLTVFFEDDKYIHLKIWVDKPEMDVNLPLLPFKPKKIIFNTYEAALCKVKYE
jgi:hypothetical protein